MSKSMLTDRKRLDNNPNSLAIRLLDTIGEQKITAPETKDLT